MHMVVPSQPVNINASLGIEYIGVDCDSKTGLHIKHPFLNFFYKDLFFFVVILYIAFYTQVWIGKQLVFRVYMRILHISSEVAPFAKVGGLADVVMGLSQQLVKQGHEISILIPSYGCVDMKQLEPQDFEERFESTFDGKSRLCVVRHFTYQKKINVLLLDTEDGYWQQYTSIYGSDVERFLFFCRAIRDWWQEGKADIIHMHDWPTALLSLFFQREVPTILTMHNFAFQGWCQWNDLERIGLKEEDFSDPSLLQDPKGECLNLVKIGLLTADKVTTVSPTYAKEVTTPEFGHGLHGVLSSIGESFIGILNGIDYSYWNPKDDPFLFEHYSVNQRMSAVRATKKANKVQLFQCLGIPCRNDLPFLATVTRLVEQKGIWLIHDLFMKADELGFQCVVLGSVPDERAAKAFRELDAHLRKTGRGGVLLVSDEECAHRLYAAADIFVAPSLFEPCGLTQLIAFKYGAVPLVRRTGGFADTVIDMKNGFLFDEPKIEHLEVAVQKALQVYQGESAWEALITCGMHEDFSWKRSGQQYVKLYQQVAGRYKK